MKMLISFILVESQYAQPDDVSNSSKFLDFDVSTSLIGLVCSHLDIKKATGPDPVPQIIYENHPETNTKSLCRSKAPSLLMEVCSLPSVHHNYAPQLI